jgi:hypothetical protein
MNFMHHNMLQKLKQINFIFKNIIKKKLTK